MSAPFTCSFGRYQVIAELGHGGMADVFLAVVRGPVGFNKFQVIKRLRSALLEDKDSLQMFLDEARLAARLNHPNIVQTNEIEQEGATYCLAMEYLEGQSYRALITRAEEHGGVPLNMHLRIIAEVLAGLHYAHQLSDFDGTPLNIVHRDVTPHNIFITYDGSVKLVDFGIAKAATSAGTKAGVMKGKVPYMAPEQVAGGTVDRRTDIFQVGVTLWEAIANRRFWPNTFELMILQHLMSNNIPDLRTAVPNVDRQLERICNRALAVRPEDRYPDAEQMRKDLERYLDAVGRRVSARDVGAFTAKLFASKRADFRRTVESQLRKLAAGVEEGTGPESIPRLGTTGSYSSSEPGTLSPVVTGQHPVVSPRSSRATSTKEPAQSENPVVQFLRNYAGVRDWLLGEANGNVVATSLDSTGRQVSAVGAYVANHIPQVIRLVNLGEFRSARVAVGDDRMLAIVCKDGLLVAVVTDERFDLEPFEQHLTKIL